MLWAATAFGVLAVQPANVGGGGTDAPPTVLPSRTVARDPPASPSRPDSSPPSKPSSSERKPSFELDDRLEFEAFVDAYAAVNYGQRPAPIEPSALRAFDASNGFAFGWAGVDLAYEGRRFGATLGFRFGPTALIYNGTDDRYGLQFVKQAYATWKPGRTRGVLSLDLGKFDTLFGAEVADSQHDMNYTRGALGWLTQPFFHTGLRVGVRPTETFAVHLLAVNGWNNSVDNNRGKSGGLQLAFTPRDRVALFVGYLVGPEGGPTFAVECGPDTAFEPRLGGCVSEPGAEAMSHDVKAVGNDRHLRHLADVVLTVQATPKLSLVGNVDYGYDEPARVGGYQPVHWYGGMVGARYGLGRGFAIAARAEVVADPQGFLAGIREARIGTGTATLEFAPVPNLILKLDTRGDASNRPLFPAAGGHQQITTTLGVVVTTAPAG